MVNMVHVWYMYACRGELVNCPAGSHPIKRMLVKVVIVNADMLSNRRSCLSVRGP